MQNHHLSNDIRFEIPIIMDCLGGCDFPPGGSNKYLYLCIYSPRYIIAERNPTTRSPGDIILVLAFPIRNSQAGWRMNF